MISPYPYSISCSWATDVCFTLACLQTDALGITLLVACAATLATWAVFLSDAVDGVLHMAGRKDMISWDTCAGFTRVLFRKVEPNESHEGRQGKEYFAVWSLSSDK